MAESPPSTLARKYTSGVLAEPQQEAQTQLLETLEKIQGRQQKIEETKQSVLSMAALEWVVSLPQVSQEVVARLASDLRTVKDTLARVQAQPGDTLLEPQAAAKELAR